MTLHRHEFENEDGMVIDLTEITYEILATYVDVDENDTLVFTHIVRVRPESIDISLQVRGPHGF